MGHNRAVESRPHRRDTRIQANEAATRMQYARCLPICPIRPFFMHTPQVSFPAQLDLHKVLEPVAIKLRSGFPALDVPGQKHSHLPHLAAAADAGVRKSGGSG